jgi:hypothetical protein
MELNCILQLQQRVSLGKFHILISLSDEVWNKIQRVCDFFSFLICLSLQINWFLFVFNLLSTIQRLGVEVMAKCSRENGITQKSLSKWAMQSLILKISKEKPSWWCKQFSLTECEFSIWLLKHFWLWTLYSNIPKHPNVLQVFGVSLGSIHTDKHAHLSFSLSLSLHLFTLSENHEMHC